MKAMVSSWLFSPSRPAPPQMAKMEMTKVATPIHGGGARPLTFFLIVFSMISPQTYTRDSRRLPGSGPFQQLPGDDEPLDLRGSFVDRKDAGVPVDPLDLVFLGIAVAAVDLQSQVGDLVGGFGREELGHGRFLGERPSPVVEIGSPVGHKAAGPEE